MKKTILSSFVITALITGCTAFASGDITYKFNLDTSDKYVALAVYSDNTLSYCGLYETKNDGFSSYITIPENISEKGNKIKIVSFESGKIISDITKEIIPTETPISSPTATENPTPSPTSLPLADTTPEPTLNPVYPKEADAVSAFAVVKNITKTIVNDETVYKLDTLYQGNEKTFFIDTDVIIDSVPESGPSIEGRELNKLEKGDIISIKAGISGKIKEIVLIMRAPEEDIVTSDDFYGSSFEFLFSKNGRPSAYESDSVLKYDDNNNARVQYALGIITDKSSSSITLCGTDGARDNFIDVDFEKTSCVYKIDMDEDEVSIENTSAIRKSSIPKAYIDEEDNIVDWNDDCEYTYALVRIVDDVATDIAVITY